MCGIVGYIGERDSVPIIMESLARWSIAGTIRRELRLSMRRVLTGSKAEGKLSRLADRLRNGEALAARLGWAHRWATHGRRRMPTRIRTWIARARLPSFTMDYRELRSVAAALIAQGHTFKSETDTEVIAHLIEVNYAGDLRAALQKTLAELRGAYALGVISSDDPEHLIFARNGASPLVVGIGDGEMFVASDTPAILQYTRKQIILQEGEMVVVGRDGWI